MSRSFRYQLFVAVSEDLVRQVPLADGFLTSHEQETYLITSRDENCKEFYFQGNQNCYLDLRETYLALKVKVVKDHGYKTCNCRNFEKENKEDAKADTERAEQEQEAPVLLVTQVNCILHLFFFQC